MYCRHSNTSNNDVIDFHGLFVKEAIEALEEKLSNTTQSKSCTLVKVIWLIDLVTIETLYVVTGKGSHSSGGVAKIKPAVIDYLDKKGYRYVPLLYSNILPHLV